MTEQTCRTCGIVKPLEAFGQYRNRGKVQWRRECKACRSAAESAKYHGCAERRATAKANTHRSRLQRCYSMTPEDLTRMQREQDDKCLICKQKPDTLHIDHCHSTGAVRGLLCGTCNRGLGLFKDNPAYLQQAIYYLQGE